MSSLSMLLMYCLSTYYFICTIGRLQIEFTNLIPNNPCAVVGLDILA